MKNFLFIFCLLFFRVYAQDFEGRDTNKEGSVVIEVNQGVVKPVSFALNITDNSLDKFGSDFLKIIKNDLEGTYLFRFISEKAFLQLLRGERESPNFLLWRTINAQYLLNVEINSEKERIYIVFRLYDIFSNSEVVSMSLVSKSSEIRKMSHIVANKVYECVTGEDGYFDTKLLYVSIQKNKYGKKIHRLAIVDQDGYNHKFLSKGVNLVLTPRLAPNGQEFAYFAYREKVVNGRWVPISAGVYRYNLKTDKTELLARFPGMTYAPRYSPDGKLLIFSLSHHGSSSIYTYDLKTKTVIRLTKGRSIDTSPCYSPDGKYIVFNSDRGGSQQLYIMDNDGSNIKRLSYSDCRYATPVWSPRGDWIAFTRFGGKSKKFYIGVIRPDGSGERMLASGHLVEGPTWSPNGRVIMFSHLDRKGNETIHSVDVTGYNHHTVSLPFCGIDPEWSSKIF